MDVVSFKSLIDLLQNDGEHLIWVKQHQILDNQVDGVALGVLYEQQRVEKFQNERFKAFIADFIEIELSFHGLELILVLVLDLVFSLLELVFDAAVILIVILIFLPTQLVVPVILVL